MNQDGIWLSILEYANVKRTSISTIRRSIKSNLLLFKEENGKYYIWTEGETLESASDATELEDLKRENKKLKEEIDDLKTLLSVYETPIPQVFTLPPLPELDL